MRIPLALRLMALLPVLAPLAPSRALEGPPPAELASALRRGGLVLYMRHPATAEGQSDVEAIDFGNCATQRNLSESGRRVAAEIGTALRAIRVQVGKAVTSGYCRARDAARLMGVAGAEVEDALNDGGRMLARGPDTPQAQALRALLRAAPPAGEVVLIVAHRPNLVDAAGPDFTDLGEAEVIVFSPSPAAPGFTRVARIRPSDWPALVAAGG